MTKRRIHVEVIDDQMAAIWRGKSGLEKLQIANGMYRSARTIIRRAVRDQHPSWTEEQVAVEASRRISHGTA